MFAISMNESSLSGESDGAEESQIESQSSPGRMIPGVLSPVRYISKKVASHLRLPWVMDRRSQASSGEERRGRSAADHSPSNEKAMLCCCRRVVDDRRSLLSFYR